MGMTKKRRDKIFVLVFWPILICRLSSIAVAFVSGIRSEISNYFPPALHNIIYIAFCLGIMYLSFSALTDWKNESSKVFFIFLLILLYFDIAQFFWSFIMPEAKIYEMIPRNNLVFYVVRLFLFIAPFSSFVILKLLWNQHKSLLHGKISPTGKPYAAYKTYGMRQGDFVIPGEIRTAYCRDCTYTNSQ